MCYIWRDLKQKNNLSNKKRRLYYIMMVGNFLERHANSLYKHTSKTRKRIHISHHSFAIATSPKKNHRKKERENYSEISSSSS